MNSPKKTVLSLFGLIFLDQTYLTITFPLITLIFFDSQSRLFSSDVDHATRSVWYGLCVALPNMINIFFAPLLSFLSDAFGRKKILLIEIFSALLFTFTVGIGVYAGNLVLIFVGFAIKGAFSRTNPTALAIIGDVVSRQEKVLYMGYLQFAISLGAALGPMIGGYFAMQYLFARFNFSLPFFIAASLACINTVLAFFFMRETLIKPVKSNVENQLSWQAIKTICTQKDVLAISLLLLLIQISWSMYYQFIPPILKTIYQFDSHQLGFFIGMIAVWLALATGIGIRMLQRFFNIQQMLLISVSLMITGYAITLIACTKFIGEQPLLAWVGALPIAAGDVIAYSCLTALYSNVVTSNQQGKVMGIALIVVASIWASTGFIGGFLMSISPILPLFIAPAGILTSLFLIRADFGKKLALSYS